MTTQSGLDDCIFYMECAHRKVSIDNVKWTREYLQQMIDADVDASIAERYHMRAALDAINSEYYDLASKALKRVGLARTHGI